MPTGLDERLDKFTIGNRSQTNYRSDWHYYIEVLYNDR